MKGTTLTDVHGFQWIKLKSFFDFIWKTVKKDKNTMMSRRYMRKYGRDKSGNKNKYHGTQNDRYDRAFNSGASGIGVQEEQEEDEEIDEYMKGKKTSCGYVTGNGRGDVVSDSESEYGSDSEYVDSESDSESESDDEDEEEEDMYKVVETYTRVTYRKK